MNFNTVFIANGVYDIVCALSIANKRRIHIPVFSTLHTGMYHTPPNERFLASAIFAWGVLRLIPYTRTVSYMLEIAFIITERERIYVSSAAFVIASSMMLGAYA